MNITKTAALGLLTTGLLSATLVACGDKDADDTGDSAVSAALALTGNAAAGSKVYQTKCAGCHDIDGTGITGPDLNDVVPSQTETSLVSVIINGEGGMPAIAVTSQEAADVAAYVWENFDS